MKKKRYGARSGAPFKKKDAQEIGEFIERMDIKTPKNILKEVKKNKECIIYSYLEWDDNKAAEDFRLQQIRNIVNHITIVVKDVDNSLPIRAFHPVMAESNGKTPIYIDLDMAFSNDYYRIQVISRAKTELQNWRERYRQYDELKEIVFAISSFIDEK